MFTKLKSFSLFVFSFLFLFWVYLREDLGILFLGFVCKRDCSLRGFQVLLGFLSLTGFLVIFFLLFFFLGLLLSDRECWVD